MKKHISVIVFWGAAWGITEATLGYVLHMMSFKIGWLFWFPLAFFFMNRVYKQTGKLSAILFTCTIASGIKLTNLLLPVRIDKVINPAVSIIFEGIVLFVVLRIIENKHKNVNTASQVLEEAVPYCRFLWLFLISIAWKVLYIIYLLPLPLWMVSISPIRAIEPFCKFFFMESALSAATIFVAMKAAKEISALGIESKILHKMFNNKAINLKNISKYAFRPIVSVGLLIFAIIIQWVL